MAARAGRRITKSGGARTRRAVWSSAVAAATVSDDDSEFEAGYEAKESRKGEKAGIN